MIDCLRGLYGDTRGATALEYGLLVALISVASVASMKAAGLGIGQALAGLVVALQ